ncbi:TRAP transporter substrate-binding protein [Propionivibrio limicola]|uniref:TRAP transporter substrate-binding protein n=1 Tax=Propionivibrio limicola TaxID=167645 RepID=UPI00129254E7|nr:TRAP transporter substrate-binding protein [Propionivibrio limicola]
MKVGSLSILSLTMAVALLAPGVSNSAEDIQARTIKFGHLNNTDHPISAAVKKFGELVAAKSGGKMQVREFPSNQLGTEQQQTAALQGGVQEMQSPATTSLVGLVKDYGVIDFPFSVSNYSQAFSLVDGPLGSALLEKLPEKGLVGLGYWDLGFRNVTNSKRPVARLEDWQGLKLRVIPNPVYLETFGVLKANPVPMSFSELYTALETKTVDGQENPFAVIRSNKFYEVQKYLSATNHVYSANVILVSKKFWDKLSTTEQKILKEAFVEARDYQRKISVEAAHKAVDELKAGGMQYNDLSPAEQERMRQAVKPTIEKFLASYDPAIQKLFASETARVQSIK